MKIDKIYSGFSCLHWWIFRHFYTERNSSINHCTSGFHELFTQPIWPQLLATFVKYHSVTCQHTCSNPAQKV